MDGEIIIYEYDGSQLTQDKWVVYPEYRQLVSNTNLTAKEYVKEGITYFNNKNDIKAEAYFHMAIERWPEYQPAYVWLGFCYAQMGRKQRAIRELTKAIKLAPNTVEAEDAKKLIKKLK